MFDISGEWMVSSGHGKEHKCSIDLKKAKGEVKGGGKNGDKGLRERKRLIAKANRRVAVGDISEKKTTHSQSTVSCQQEAPLKSSV
jgi:hypothetical protein